MGQIHATINISLDGCCDHTQVVADEEFHERISDVFDEPAALLFGRKTYDLLHGYWPGVASRGDGRQRSCDWRAFSTRSQSTSSQVVIPRPGGRRGEPHQRRMRSRL